MAKDNNLFTWVVIIIVLVSIYYYNKDVETIGSGHATSAFPYTNVSTVVSPSVSFTAQNIFNLGTSTTTESVRVLKINGDKKDLGAISLNSGTQNLQPSQQYKFYFFINATAPSASYYVWPMSYTAPIQDSQVAVVGKACQIDTSPVFSVINQNGQTQTAYTNAQSVAAGETKTVTIRVKAHASKCYGMLNATKGNILCFGYPGGAAFSRIYTNGNFATPPSSISSSSTMAGKTVTCYEFKPLQDGESLDILTTLVGGTTEPTTAHNITVMADDIDMDLDQSNLQEILGYVDENDNQLGAAAVNLGTIYIS